MSLIQEILTGLRIVKSFGRENQEKQRFINRSELGMWARIRTSFIEGHFALFVGIITAIGTTVVLYIGLRHVQLDLITLQTQYTGYNMIPRLFKI